jgi:hypothetical protein|tara:strand:- start:313 stop:492 length:180 start_codon:yes stop_codon:yes gene_type:complete
MLDRFLNWITLIKEYRIMMKASKFFDKNPVVQGRFEDLEEWCIELEEEIRELKKKISNK